MRVADGAGERVGCVRTGGGIEAEQPLHHLLYLGFVGLAVADHGLLHLQCRVFMHGRGAEDRGAEHGAARLPQEQGRLGVEVDEDFFDGDLGRVVGGDELLHAAKERGEPLG